MTDSTLDGNALAGILEGVLGADPTTVEQTCPSCGAVHAVGAHRMYVSAGFVLRCPACGDVVATLVVRAEGEVVRARGFDQLR
jgi:predicted RNA-binding Zn-ribbon protein involved in translation (DUF1610 family)